MKPTLLFLGLITTTFAFSQPVPKKEWIGLYKQYATFRCMCEVTNNQLEKNLDKKDISYVVHREILGNYGDRADSAGRDFARKIRLIDAPEGSDLSGFHTKFNYCMMYFNNRTLDRLARKSYLDYIQTELRERQNK